MTASVPLSADRIAATIRALILNEVPELVYAATYEYAVTAVRGDGSVDGTCTDPSAGVPDLNAVPMGALACGGVSTPTVGSLFLVDFLNADGTRYAVVSCALVKVATLDASSTVNVGPSASNPVKLGPSPAAKVARVGDQITVYWPPGLLNGTLTPPSLPPVPIVNLPMQILTPAPALITTGNEQVLS
jgi:hypothetical protein